MAQPQKWRFIIRLTSSGKSLRARRVQRLGITIVISLSIISGIALSTHTSEEQSPSVGFVGITNIEGLRYIHCIVTNPSSRSFSYSVSVFSPLTHFGIPFHSGSQPIGFSNFAPRKSNSPFLVEMPESVGQCHLEVEGLRNPGALKRIQLRLGTFFANRGMNQVGQMFGPSYRPEPIHLQGPRLAGSTVSM
jgi:hypothetical protein